jgi:hypothetical protein
MIPRLLKRSAWLLLVLCVFGMQTAAQTSSSEGLAAIQFRITQLENEIHKARAIRDIKTLQYSYAHYAELGLWLDLGDLFARDGVAHYAQGDFRGPESLRKFYLQELGRGQLGLADGRIYPHIMIQPVVTVAADGKTAKGRWHVIAMLGSYGASASWAGVVYENRYVFEDGVWKISELGYNSQYSGRYSPPALTLSKWDLPYHFTPQSVGDPVSHADSSGSSKQSTTGSANFKDLQQRWVELARSAQQLQDETEVLNLQHTYGYYSDQKWWDAAASLFAGNATLELGQRGVYVGRDRIRKALSVIGGKTLGAEEVHDHLQLATVVHVAPDAKTAKVRGVELSVGGLKGKSAQWEEGIFENEYVKEDRNWKIQSVHYYPRVITDYEQGWAKNAKPAPGPSVEFPPDRPSSEVYAIYPKMYYPRLHYANPVTHSAVQYPPGVNDLTPRASSPAVPARLPKDAKDLASRLNELEVQIHSSIGYDAVENLVNAQGYYLEDSRDDAVRGIAAVDARLPQRNPRDSAAVYQTVQPLIHVSPDGKAATIRARLLKVGGKPGELSSGLYEGRATIRDGAWKLESLTLRQTWASSLTPWMPVLVPQR